MFWNLYNTRTKCKSWTSNNSLEIWQRLLVQGKEGHTPILLQAIQGKDLKCQLTFWMIAKSLWREVIVEQQMACQAHIVTLCLLVALILELRHPEHQISAEIWKIEEVQLPLISNQMRVALCLPTTQLTCKNGQTQHNRLKIPKTKIKLNLGNHQLSQEAYFWGWMQHYQETLVRQLCKHIKEIILEARELVSQRMAFAISWFHQKLVKTQ